MTLSSLLFTSVLVPSCVGVIGDEPGSNDDTCREGKCDGKGGGVCTDQRYGDGACDIELACAAPDIDCFVTFDNDQGAASWYGELEAIVASNAGGAPRQAIAETDPRFTKTRELLDRGWKAFRDQRPVGELYGLRPALVVLDDETMNAFVTNDFNATMNVGFAVIVQTGLIENVSSDDEVLGVMMHEFQHAVGLHAMPGVSDRIRKFYIAPPGNEPIGNRVDEDPIAREYGTAWRQYAEEAGAYSSQYLGGYPLGEGLVQQVFTIAVQRGVAANPSGCQTAKQALRNIEGVATPDPLSGAVTGNVLALESAIDAAMSALRNPCMAGFAPDFLDILAEIGGVTRAEIQAGLSASDLALVAGKNIIDGISAFTKDRRSKMRALEQGFTEETGLPWSQLRYFSDEENADDVSVLVLHAAGASPTGLADYNISAVPELVRDGCRELIARGQVPPYGVDLLDQHHASCWRAFHITQIANDLSGAKRAPARTVRSVDNLPPRIPFPKRPRDYIKY
ncbi:MAG: M48 family metalloprotease [Kofleriaceae bacterium]